MNKKYQIVNSDSNENCTIFYLLYIVLIFVIIFIIYKIIFKTYSNEGFTTIESPQKNLSPEQIMQELQEKNNELLNIKNSLQTKLEQQSKGIYMNQNFNKVDSSSFNNELKFLLMDFTETKLPQIDMSKKKIIRTPTQLSAVLSEASQMKNFYKPGEIVSENSTFGITKDNICYRHDGKPIKPTPSFMEQYPNCMVCTTDNSPNFKNSNAWLNTKTNIDKVCLYNPKAEANSGIPNLEQCQKFCNISSK